jgi:hypothetical protein
MTSPITKLTVSRDTINVANPAHHLQEAGAYWLVTPQYGTADINW